MPLAIIGIYEGDRPKRSQIGIYDSRILCEQCDGELGKLDQHACEVLLEKNLAISDLAGGKAIDGNGDTLCYTLEGANPEIIWKFVLSVIWRSHHSTREEVARVKLGMHELKIKAILLNQQPFTRVPYSVVVEYNPDFKMCMVIGRNRQDGIMLNTFYARNFGFHMKTDQQEHSETFRLISLATDRPVYAMNIRKLDTRFGKTVVSGLRKNFSKFGTPWKRKVA